MYFELMTSEKTDGCLLSVIIYLRTKVLHGHFQPVAIVLSNVPILPFPVLSFPYKRNVLVKRFWKNVHSL